MLVCYEHEPHNMLMEGFTDAEGTICRWKGIDFGSGSGGLAKCIAHDDYLLMICVVTVASVTALVTILAAFAASEGLHQA